MVNAREQMIEQQVRAWEVLDARVLSLLRSVPRERFVPESQRFLAFADVNVPLPNGQHMLRPNIVGRLLQALGEFVREHLAAHDLLLLPQDLQQLPRKDRVPAGVDVRSRPCGRGRLSASG